MRSLIPQKPLPRWLGDLVVFEPPIDSCKCLILELPASAFGGEGMLRFKIPTLAMMRLAEQSGAFDFWREEGEDVYTPSDGEPI